MNRRAKPAGMTSGQVDTVTRRASVSTRIIPASGGDCQEQVTALLAHLGRGGAWGYWWTDARRRSTWWPAGDPAPIPTDRANCYFGVHPTAQQRGEGQRARIQDVAAVNCVFGDFDAKDYAGGKAEALAHVDSLDPAPSVVIDSGGGFHAYWLLLEPFTLATDTKRQRAKEVQARWVEYVGGDPGTKDLAHVLRVPGTRNLKPEYAPDFPTVTVIRADFGRLYDLDALEALLPPPEPETPPIPREVDKTDGRDRWAEAALADELQRLGRAIEGTRNRILFSATRNLFEIVAEGLLDGPQVERALYDAAVAIGLDKDPNCGPRGIERTIRSGIEAGMKKPRGPKDDGQQPQRARPLGARLPSKEARAIEAIAPRCPDPDLRGQIIGALLEKTPDGRKMMPALLRRQKAGRLLLAWLGENGGFVRSEGGDRYYFHRPGRRLYDLESDRWAAWLYALSGANPAGTDYAHLLADCKAAAINAPTRAVVRVAAWDPQDQVLRVSRFDGTLYVLDGERITEEANGEAALFDDLPQWRPYRPDFTRGGEVLRWHTAKLPNWTANDPQEREAYGLALRAWILTTGFTELCPTRPMAATIGEKGAGKSMIWRLLLRFMFGAGAEVSGVPDKPDGFTAAAAAAHVLVLDNLDDFRGWLRDKLARLSTGGVDEYRRLYTSNEVGRVHYRCWLAFTSRTPDTLRRDDLADRLLLLPLDRIGADALQAEREFLERADQDRGAWWGDVLQALNDVVGRIRRGDLQSRSTLRMADWESLGRLVAQAEGATQAWDGFIEKLGRAQADFLLEGDLIVEGLNLWLEESANYGREVTAKTLHQELGRLLFEDKKPPSDWPRSAVGFGRRLAGIRRELRTLWQVEWGKGTTPKTRDRAVYQFWPVGGGQLGLDEGEISL